MDNGMRQRDASGVGARRPIVIVLGCDELGSAIAATLQSAGASVILIDDADPPWARRGMSYTDAWYVGGATLDGIDACFCGSVKSGPALLARGDMIAATTWSCEGVAAAVAPQAIVETRPGLRMSGTQARPALLDGVLAIGVCTTQVAGWNADAVIAGPAQAALPPPKPRHSFLRAHSAGTRRTRIEAPHAGRFRTQHQIAERVEAGDVLGEIGSFVAVAPVAGALIGLAARGARMASGQTLLEIDSSGEPHRCFGIRDEARAIAQRVRAALRMASAPARPQAVETRFPALA
jgi:xanthine dehydrogenase accessory factor